MATRPLTPLVDALPAVGVSVRPLGAAPDPDRLADGLRALWQAVEVLEPVRQAAKRPSGALRCPTLTRLAALHVAERDWLSESRDLVQIARPERGCEWMPRYAWETPRWEASCRTAVRRGGESGHHLPPAPSAAFETFARNDDAAGAPDEGWPLRRVLPDLLTALAAELHLCRVTVERGAEEWGAGHEAQVKERLFRVVLPVADVLLASTTGRPVVLDSASPERVAQFVASHVPEPDVVALADWYARRHEMLVHEAVAEDRGRLLALALLRAVRLQRVAGG